MLDLNSDKAYPSICETEYFQVSSDIWRAYSVPGGEPVVLFKRGAVRLLDSLLSAPQQPIEAVVSHDETIWSVLLDTFKSFF